MIINVAQGAPARVMPDERSQGRPPHHGQQRPQQQQRPPQFRQPQPSYINQQAQQRPAQFVPRFNQPSQPPMSHHQQVIFTQFYKHLTHFNQAFPSPPSSMVQQQPQQQFQPPGIRPHYRPQVQPQYARQNNQVRDSNNYPTSNNNYRVRNQHQNQPHRSNQHQNGD